MADERSTISTHQANPNQEKYDWEYYKILLPHITGEVLDIGSGALMFVKEYIKRPEVTFVTCIDKFQEQEVPNTVNLIEWVCPEKLPTDLVFDTIVSTEFIEHIPREDLEPLLEQIVKRMHKDSKFIGSTPNKIAPTTNPYHLYEYTLPELRDILEKYFSRIEITDNGQNCSVWIAQL